MRTARNILFTLAAMSIAFSCKNEVKSVIQQSTDPEVTPTMLTTDITTLVSDSGVTKYRITSQRWEMYDESDTPNWVFPKGLFLEQFDSTLKVEATFECDSARYLKNSKLWQFMGNVRSWNTKKDLILTNELYWDQNKKKVYSDSFIHIEQPERILEGYGFESNERLTTYKLKRPMGIFPVNEENRKSSSARRDSLNALRADSTLK
ncbi:MAG: LPS export ABC transporter periplasmic protein LptC [Bacteroidales bacterium]|nr:LPS export ABC transporter periplasmic protein LptC [Bacteroidales bacterium]